jgi:hypothetical protein
LRAIFIAFRQFNTTPKTLIHFDRQLGNLSALAILFDAVHGFKLAVKRIGSEVRAVGPTDRSELIDGCPIEKGGGFNGSKTGPNNRSLSDAVPRVPSENATSRFQSGRALIEMTCSMALLQLP